MMAMLLFVPAGTLHWPAAWVLLAELGILGFASGLWLAWTDPDLLRERMSPFVQRDQEASDRALMKIISLAFVVWLVFMPLDACRFGWSRSAVDALDRRDRDRCIACDRPLDGARKPLRRRRRQSSARARPARDHDRSVPVRASSDVRRRDPFVCWDAPAARLPGTASSAPWSSSGCSAFASRSRSARSAPSSRATRSMRPACPTG